VSEDRTSIYEAARGLKHKPRQLLVQHRFPVLHTYYSRITSTKSPSFCITTFSANLAHLTIPLPQSHDCSCYVRRRILVPPPLGCIITLIYAHMTSRTVLTCDIILGCSNVTCVTSWRLCGINPAILSLLLSQFTFSEHSGSGMGSTQPREVNWGATWIKK